MPTLSTKPHSQHVSLAQNTPMILTHARGVELCALAGMVWITEAGEAGDGFLRAGERYRIRDQGLVVLEAVRDTTRVEYRRTGFLPWLFGLAPSSRMLTTLLALRPFANRHLGTYPSNFSSFKSITRHLANAEVGACEKGTSLD
jgi:hypothetical protein